MSSAYLEVPVMAEIGKGIDLSNVYPLQSCSYMSVSLESSVATVGKERNVMGLRLRKPHLLQLRRLVESTLGSASRGKTGRSEAEAEIGQFLLQ